MVYLNFLCNWFCLNIFKIIFRIFNKEKNKEMVLECATLLLIAKPILATGVGWKAIATQLAIIGTMLGFYTIVELNKETPGKIRDN